MDITMARIRISIVLLAAFTVSAFALQAQSGDPALLQQKLLSQFKLAKSTADHTDLVTAGDVIVLHKDGLMMCSSASSYAYSNSYSNGVLAANEKNRAKDASKSFLKSKIPFGGGQQSDPTAGCQSRKFVAGEKFWITGISAQKDGIVFSVISDPYQDVRYYGELKFVFKGAVPSPDDFVKTVAEVLTVDSSNADNSQQQGNNSNAGQNQNQAQQQQQAPTPAPLPDIAPPPPPADTPPPTIAIGQTIAQVTGAFGQPTRIAKLGAKQIYYYKDMKVTFTNGKVSNVE
jgi:hypothetical protein